jgi:acetoin utilization protein AcuB
MMRISEFMSTPVESVSPDEPIDLVRARMRGRRIHHLVVLDRGAVVGVVSDRDLRGVAGAQVVAEVMSQPVATATPRTTVREAANLLRGRSIGCLPVLDGGRLVGMVTVTDLLELLGRGLERPTPTSQRWIMRGRGPRKRAVAGERSGRR